MTTDRRLTRPEENDLLSFVRSWQDAAKAELTATKLCAWILVWGLLMVGAMLMMHLGA